MYPMAHMNDKIVIAILGGSGLEDALGAQTGKKVTPVTPFGPPSSPITRTIWQGVEVAILQRHGPGHLLNPSQVPSRANIFALKSLGVTHIVASGATGSLSEHIYPGDLVIIDQVIDKTCNRANTFFDRSAVHVEMAEPFCPVMRRWLCEAGKRQDGVQMHPKGTYVCMEGPAFSTRAESLMHRQWGGDLIGMTCMPEARLAREAEIAYAMIALPTDYDCWRPYNPSLGPQELLGEIVGNLKRASAAGISLIKAALADVTILKTEPSSAHDALKLAIWSDKSKIDSQEVDRLGVIWGRHFES